MSPDYIRAVPTIDLRDDELAAVTATVGRAIEGDRYPRAPRLDPLRSALGARQARSGDSVEANPAASQSRQAGAAITGASASFAMRARTHLTRGSELLATPLLRSGPSTFERSLPPNALIAHKTRSGNEPARTSAAASAAVESDLRRATTSEGSGSGMWQRFLEAEISACQTINRVLTGKEALR